jgi:hypothetical protein
MNQRAISHGLTSLVLPIRASQSAGRNPPRAAALGPMPEPLSRSYLNFELNRGVSKNDKIGGVSETHLLLCRPIIQTIVVQQTIVIQTETGPLQSTTTGTLRAGVTAGPGQTKSTITIPRHAQRLFLLDHQPAQYPQPPATIPTTQAAARWSKRTTETAQSKPKLESSRTVRRYQANGYLNATNVLWFSARPALEQS